MCTTLVGGRADPVAALRASVDALASMDVAALPSTEVLDLAAELSASIARLTGVRWPVCSRWRTRVSWGLDGSRSMPWALARREDAGIASVRAEVTLAQRLAGRAPAHRGRVAGRDRVVGQGEAVGAGWRRRATPAAPPYATRTRVRRSCWRQGPGPRRVGTDPGGPVLGLPGRPGQGRPRLTATTPGPFELQIADTLDGGDVRGLLSPETTELVRTALRAIIGVPDKTDRRTTPQRYADALGDLARFFLDSGTCTGGGSGGGKVRPHLSVHVGWDAFTEQARQAGVDPATFVETGQPIPRTVFERIACDSEVTRVVFGPDSEPLDVGRAQRTVTPAQRRAVIARDKTCRGPDCHAPPRLCDVHHLIWWTRGGVTSVRELRADVLALPRLGTRRRHHDHPSRRDVDLHPPRRAYHDPRTRPAHRLTHGGPDTYTGATRRCRTHTRACGLRRSPIPALGALGDGGALASVRCSRASGRRSQRRRTRGRSARWRMSARTIHRGRRRRSRRWRRRTARADCPRRSTRSR